MKWKYCLLAMLWPALNCFAQNPPSAKIHALTIGDMVPDLILTNVYNYPVSKIQLSNLKGKLIILDFWSTWCKSCIESFPKMQHLQNDFKDQLQVVLVNTYEGDTGPKVKAVFDRRAINTGKKVSLPYSLLQKSLMSYFPYKYVPHYIWIDKKGKIIAITSQTEISKGNIEKALKGDVTAIHNKKDLLDFDKSKPLFVDGNGGNGNSFLYRSIYTGYIEGLGYGSGIQHDEDGKITRFYIFNTPLSMLLKLAYGGKMDFSTNRILFDSSVANRVDFISHSDSSVYSNSYCYEIAIPPSTDKELKTYMQQDIQRLFKVVVKNEERDMDCIVLKAGTQTTSLSTKGETPLADIDKSSLKKVLRNQPMQTLADILNSLPAFNTTPLIDETGITQNIDINLPDIFPDMSLPAIINFLKEAGFEVEKTTRKIPVAIITNK